MTIPIYQVDAFTSMLFSGNPAAVCPLEEWLPDSVLQNIAMENNLSETAFYVPGSDRIRLRWFTPRVEVDLCGHATLASAHVLFEHHGYDSDEVRFITKSGELTVKREEALLVMDFPSNSPEPAGLPGYLVDALGEEPEDCLLAMDYLLIYEDEDQVRNIDPDFSALKKPDFRGVIVSAPGDEVDFVSRFFAPGVGVDEDPVTGSTHTELAPYWSTRLQKEMLKARQVSRRGGEVRCRMLDDRVEIGGQARTYLSGTIQLPK